MNRPTTLLLLTALATSAAASAPACSHGTAATPSSGATQTPPTAPAPFFPVPPSVYVPKAKNVLVGLPATDAEIAQVVADPTALKGLIDGWRMLPQYSEKMLRFFELAFQQTQVSAIDFAEQTFPRQPTISQPAGALLVENATESFARTVLELNTEGRPLTDAMTTQRFMMTPALMEFYAFLDTWQVDDAGKVTDRFKVAYPNATITAEASAGPIPIAESIDPTSPNFMHWYDPDVANDGNSGTGCAADPLVYPVSASTLHYLLQGSLDNRKGTAGTTCGQVGGSLASAQLTAADFATWKMVTVRPPASGEQPTRFYDLPTLRSATELVLQVPRVGFFSTPAFFANWQTNVSNTMRVTANQALIVATGAAIDGTDDTAPSTTPGLDAAHAAPGSACFHCHQLLDPTRSILSATYSWNYHDQTNSSLTGETGLFAFEGVVKPVSSIQDFAAQLASHPLFASAWVQKLCYYGASRACEPTDPEFQRVVGVFQSSGYSFDALVRELFSSPLFTNATATQTSTDSGEVIAVSRRDHLCAALDARLGYTDLCGLDPAVNGAQKTVIPQIVPGLPSDGYGRGGAAPVLPNQPTLFYRAGTENICEAIAALVIDPPKTGTTGGTPAANNPKQWSSTAPTPAIADFVQIVMALPPSDPRSSQANAILTSHFKAAVSSGASASDALKSTFTTACLAPSAVAIGL